MDEELMQLLSEVENQYPAYFSTTTPTLQVAQPPPQPLHHHHTYSPSSAAPPLKFQEATSAPPFQQRSLRLFEVRRRSGAGLFLKQGKKMVIFIHQIRSTQFAVLY